jgi:hypothetical protein
MIEVISEYFKIGAYVSRFRINNVFNALVVKSNLAYLR